MRVHKFQRGRNKRRLNPLPLVIVDDIASVSVDSPHVSGPSWFHHDREPMISLKPLELMQSNEEDFAIHPQPSEGSGLLFPSNKDPFRKVNVVRISGGISKLSYPMNQ